MNGLNACERQNLHDRSRADDSTERGRDHQPGIDRMYLNVFVPDLQYEQGIVHFFRTHRGQPLPSAALMSPMTRSFVAGARFASYGLASHAAIINGKDSRKGRRGSGFQLKYRKQPHAK